MKKVLIISYYWPPAGGPGVQRWLKFVKYLRDFDIDPIVYVPENPHYPIRDTTLLSEIPTGITLLKHPIFEPYSLASLVSSKKTRRISSGVIDTKNQTFLEKTLLWIRGNLFIPDARKYWVRPSIKYLGNILEQENIGTIVTTGPPHTSPPSHSTAGTVSARAATTARPTCAGWSSASSEPIRSGCCASSRPTCASSWPPGAVAGPGPEEPGYAREASSAESHIEITWPVAGSARPSRVSR